MNRVKLDNLPVLPFEKILSYLSLEDRIKCRAVSRNWHKKIDSFRVNSLCFSERPSGFIDEKGRLVSGEFAQNFIYSPRFSLFFDVFATNLANLKHLRLCELRTVLGNETAFVQALNSFSRLEQLDIINIEYQHSSLGFDFELDLPMLTTFWLEKTYGIEKLTLNAPELHKVKLWDCADLFLSFVNGESVEKLVITSIEWVEVRELRNLKYLYHRGYLSIDSTFLSGLKQLKEFHLGCYENYSEIFEQKRQYGRADLKIYLFGCLLNGPDKPAIDSEISGFSESTVDYLAKHPSRQPEEIPFHEMIYYKTIEAIAPEMALNFLKKLTDLKAITVYEPVPDIESFLDLLKRLPNINELQVHDVQWELFDRLPEHSAVQKLYIYKEDLDLKSLESLFQLKTLTYLDLSCYIDAEMIRRVLEGFEFLSNFEFNISFARVAIEITQPKLFKVQIKICWVVSSSITVSDVNSAIQFIIKETL